MFLNLTDRRILPRWRDFQTTAALGELDSVGAERPHSFESLSLASRIREFALHPVPWVATDLVSTAFALGEPERAVHAARFIIENEGICPPASVALARRVLHPESGRWTVPEVANITEELIQRRIHDIRVRLREEPRNSILWVELARLYTIAGHAAQAKRAIRAACALSPSNRFVLRAAVRLFTHYGAPITALRILGKASSVRGDPWLLAAEVGAACVAELPPRFAKQGFSLVENKGFSDFEVTELASSLATLELREGSVRRARKYFRRSLASPTENSVAQAEWASKILGGLEVDVMAYEVPRPFEAQAFDNFGKGNWVECLNWCRKWHWDQPFSSRPPILASYVTSALENYEDSIDMIKSSLVSNPGDPTLLNNLAFALASLDRTGEAEEVLSFVDAGSVSGPASITLTATRGLVSFRKGSVEEGRQFYLQAMELAKKNGIPTYRALAAAYLAREEIVAGTSSAIGALRRAIAEARGHNRADVLEIITRILRMGEAHNLSP